MLLCLRNLSKPGTNLAKVCVSPKVCPIRRHSAFGRPFVSLVTSRPAGTMGDQHHKAKVYITRRIPLSALTMLTNRYDVRQWDSDEPVPSHELINNVSGVDALFCLLTDQISYDVLKAAGPSLKVVATMSVGYDHVDLEACKALGIPVGYTPDVLTDATAELTVSLLLATCRRLVEAVRAVKDGTWSTWKPMWMCGWSLVNSTVGIVGLGRIGFGVAKRLLPFGPTAILYSGHTPKDSAAEVGAIFVTFDELLQQSDFVIATCPMNNETAGLFNKTAFQKMKKSAIFINTSRGGVVNQDDLYDALVSGEIAAAGLDVTVPEPLPTDDKLLSLDNCVILPHIGSATIDTRTRMAEITACNIIAALEGEPMPCPLQL